MGIKNSIITEAQFRKILSESLKLALNEDAESSAMKAAINFLIQQGQSKEQAQQIFNALRSDIPSIRLPLYTNTNGKEKGSYKFAIGVERMYLNGELSDGQTIMKLNKTLKLLANGHADEYDANLNNMSAQELNRRFETAAASELQNDIDAVNSEEYTPNGYTVVRIPDFKTAEEYGDYTSWCVTHYEGMYDSYTGDGAGLFYFFLKNGFEQIKPIKGDGCPLDEYGLSMIAVSINMDGSLNTVTCRWNHDNGGNDNVMDAKQLSRTVGMNVYNICKPYTREELHAKGIIPFDEVQDLLDKGTPPKEIFERLYEFYEGFAVVRLRGKYNFINTEGKLLSNQWFDDADVFCKGFAYVELHEKCNFINREGKVISNQWFDDADSFDEGFACVELNKKWNFINTEGNLISNQWFDDAQDFREGVAVVELDEGYNFINTEGKLLSNQWFDNIGDFREGFAVVELYEEYNFINTEGKLISNQWFDNIGNFHEGVAVVCLNDKWNFINTEGKLLTNQWFDSVFSFIDGFGVVKLNEKFNYINTEGKLLSKQWFDKVSYFKDGVAGVVLRGRWLFINTEGQITDTLNESKTKKYMKQKIKVTESQLRNMITKSVKKVLKERKEDSIFKSKEDATYWRDLYDPRDEYSEPGPYMSYRGPRTFDDSDYDYCGDDDYNDYASDYNGRLRKRLATKGGQISYEFDANPNVRNPFITKREHDALEKDYDERKRFNAGRDNFANNIKRAWINGEMDDDTFKKLSDNFWLDTAGDWAVNHPTRK